MIFFKQHFVFCFIRSRFFLFIYFFLSYATEFRLLKNPPQMKFIQIHLCIITLSPSLSHSHVPPPPSENKCQVFRLAQRSSSRLDQSNVFVQKQTQPFGPPNFWLHIQRGGIFVPQNLCLQIIRAFFDWFLSLKWAILFVVNYLGLLLFFKKNGE